MADEAPRASDAPTTAATATTTAAATVVATRASSTGGLGDGGSFSELQRGYRRVVECEADGVETAEVTRRMAQLHAAVAAASLVSRNETLDDISTGSLKYLLVPFYLGDLISRGYTSNRIPMLKRAIASMSSFLEDVERLKLVHPDDLFSVRTESPADPSAARAMKLAQYAREKQAKQALQQQVVASDLARKRNEDPEEADREQLLCHLRLSAIQCCQQLKMTQQELDMLEQIEKMKATGRMPTAPPRPPPPPQQPITILPVASASRLQVQSRVFQPGYSLPTMTPEQAFELDMQNNSNYIVRQADTTTRTEETERDEDAGDDDPDAVNKARRWDAWKDTHPTGSGNKKGQG
ncbi:PP2A regulatory subunit TAP46 [Pelomyxa schiedti]|nr:PP2A regulatory subunit TAP46 [Pelomyxa schiedti]KAH3761310.1 PP2A regulatory subunit TAP46 [Pelomyxa schiedti]